MLAVTYPILGSNEDHLFFVFRIQGLVCPIAFYIDILKACQFQHPHQFISMVPVGLPGVNLLLYKTISFV